MVKRLPEAVENESGNGMGNVVYCEMNQAHDVDPEESPRLRIVNQKQQAKRPVLGWEETVAD